MLVLSSIPQSPLGPSRVVTPAAWSFVRVNRAKGAFRFLGGSDYGHPT